MTDEPRAATTMADVAREAGVSVMTVSNVVNERQARVSDATRARVREAIEATGYRLNVQARGRRRGRTGTVALAVPDFSSAYFGELGSRLERRLRRHGFRLVLESTGGVLAEELAALGASHLDAYDGLVLSLAADSTGEVARLSPAKPVVLVGERAAPPQLDHVGMDNVAGARRATDLLLDSGATRIAVVGAAASGPESMAVLRTRGHLESLAAHGLATRPELLIDSGVGGLTICASISRRLPDADLIMVADSAFFPYGNKTAEQIRERVTHLATTLVAEHKPDVLVLACNTATVYALQAVRQALELPVIGTIPSVKPAARASLTGVVGVLATPATGGLPPMPGRFRITLHGDNGQQLWREVIVHHVP